MSLTKALFTSIFRRPTTVRTGIKLGLVALEDRTTPTTVDISGDIVDPNDGKISLREAVALFNTAPDTFGNNTISFDSSLLGTTLTLTSELAITGKTGATNKSLELSNGDIKAITISGNNASRIFNVASTAELSIGRFILTNGSADKGGAILNAGTLTLNDTTITNNEATGTGGGGIFNATTGTVKLFGADISSNKATAATGDGGGILDDGGQGVTISLSLIRANRAGRDGGGIAATGALTIYNSTLASNAANNDGGAIKHTGTFTSINTTIALNSADADQDSNGKGGALLVGTGGTANLSNTLIAGNLIRPSTANDISGTVSGTSKNNLVGDSGSAGGLTNGTNGNVVGDKGSGTLDISVVLDNTLKINAGIGLPNFALVANSPAIDKGDKTLSIIPGTTFNISSDQRNAFLSNVGMTVKRVVGTNVDIGAFEYQNTPPSITIPTNKINLTEDGAGFAFTGAGNTFTVADDAFASPAYSMTLQVPKGKLSLATTTGLTNLTGNGTEKITFSSTTLASINTALASLTFNQLTDQNGAVNLSVTLSDGETAAPGGELKGNSEVTINITPLVDTPTVTSPATKKDTPVFVNLTRNPVDGPEITHFKVTNIKNGTLTYLEPDTDTGKRVTVVEGATNFWQGTFGKLVPDEATIFTFTPTPGFEGVASFDVQAGIGGYGVGQAAPVYSGPVITSKITVDGAAPTAAIGDAPAVDAVFAGAATYDFTVIFSDNNAIDASTIDSTAVRVAGPNGFDQLAELVNVTPAGNGTPRTASYRVAAPGGTWDVTDNGAYTITLVASRIGDTAGNKADAANLGNFTATLLALDNPDAGQPKLLLVGSPLLAIAGDRGSDGKVQVLYQDRSVRFTLASFGGFTGGVRTAIADFNGDGVPDLVVGTGPGRATRVEVYNGQDGTTLLFGVDPFEASFKGGVYVAAGDVTGDGKADLVITPDEGGGPRVRVFSGDGFGLVADFLGIEDPNFRGGARASIGDLNGDGVGDLVVAAGFGGGPRIAIFNGKSLGQSDKVKLLPDFLAFEPGLRNGTFVTVGDVNGDGFADLVAGGGPGGGPRVTVFDGQGLLANKQAPIADFFAGDVNSRGGVRVAVKNLDGDNRADIVVGSGAGSGSKVTSYLGKTIAPNSTPPVNYDFEAIPGFKGGIFVG